MYAEWMQHISLEIKDYLYLKRQNRKSKKFNKKLSKEFIKPRQDRKIKINKN